MTNECPHCTLPLPLSGTVLASRARYHKSCAKELGIEGRPEPTAMKLPKKGEKGSLTLTLNRTSLRLVASALAHRLDALDKEYDECRSRGEHLKAAGLWMQRKQIADLKTAVFGKL